MNYSAAACLFAACAWLAFCGCADDSPEPALELPSWFIGDWEGECYTFQATPREELWRISDPGAAQNQYYCGSTNLIYTPRSFSSWQISGDTLRFQLPAGTDQIVKFRIDSWGGGRDDLFQMYKIVDTGWVWVPYRRAQ